MVQAVSLKHHAKHAAALPLDPKKILEAPLEMDSQAFATAEARLRKLLGNKISEKQALPANAVRTFAKLQNPESNASVSANDIAQIDALYQSGNKHVAEELSRIAAGKIDDDSMACMANCPEVVTMIVQHLERRKQIAVRSITYGTPQERKKIIDDCDRVLGNFEKAKNIWPEKYQLNLIAGKIGTRVPITSEEKQKMMRHPEILEEYISDMKDTIRDSQHELRKGKKLSRQTRMMDQGFIKNSRRGIQATRRFQAENGLKNAS